MMAPPTTSSVLLPLDGPRVRIAAGSSGTAAAGLAWKSTNCTPQPHVNDHLPPEYTESSVTCLLDGPSAVKANAASDDRAPASCAGLEKMTWASRPAT